MRLLAWLACTAVALWFGWLKQPAQVDDASIYLRYARNVVEGHGWVFNAGEAVNGATSTGNTLLLVALSWLTGGRYHLAQLLVFALGLGAAGFGVWRLFRPQGAAPAFLATAIVMTLPYLYWLVGMDSALILGFAAAATAAYQARRFRLCAFLLAWLVLVRGDGVLLACLLLLHWLWTERRGLRAQAGLLATAAALFLVPIAAWSLFSLAEFGTALPKTLGAKLAQTRSGLFGPPPVFLRWGLEDYNLFCSIRAPHFVALHGYPLNVAALAFLGLGALGALGALVRRHACWPLIAFGLLQFAAYYWLDLPNYAWYYVPAHLALGLGLAVLASWCWRLAWPGRTAALAILAAWLWVHAPDPRRITSQSHPGYVHYKSETQHPWWFECAAWLRAQAGERGSLATAEIGILGFELPHWRIVDMWGLVTKGGVEAIARGDFTWWLRDEKPDWVVLHEPVWLGPESQVLALPEFAKSYELAHRATRYTLWRRRRAS